MAELRTETERSSAVLCRAVLCCGNIKYRINIPGLSNRDTEQMELFETQTGREDTGPI